MEEKFKNFLKESYDVNYHGGSFDNNIKELQEAMDSENPSRFQDTLDFSVEELYFIDNIIREIEGEMKTNMNEREIEYLKDEIRGRIEHDFFDEALKNTDDFNIRIELNSNHDCINSYRAEALNGEELSIEEKYLEDVLSFCKIDPVEFKKEAKDRGVKTKGRFKKRKGCGIFSAYDLLSEFQELHCPASLFTIKFKMKASDLIEVIDGKKFIALPKGTGYGFYSECQGGGSDFVAETLKEYILDLSYTGKTKHDHLSIRIDDPDNSYHMKNCFGVTDGFFSPVVKLIKK